jgi:hypothetical protein
MKEAVAELFGFAAASLLYAYKISHTVVTLTNFTQQFHIETAIGS